MPWAGRKKYLMNVFFALKHTVYPTVLTTDYCFDDRSGHFVFKERVDEDVIVAKINNRICELLLMMMEKMFNVWRYNSSILSLFHAQISSSKHAFQ